MNKFITLYSDEFPSDVWEEYCEVLNISEDSHEVKVLFHEVIVDSKFSIKGTQH